MCEQVIDNNKKLTFLSTKTLQKTQVYICINSAESCRLRWLSEFHLQLLPGVDMLPKILELCRLPGY